MLKIKIARLTIGLFHCYKHKKSNHSFEWFFIVKNKAKRMTNKIICYIVLAVLLLSTRANAQINIFTEHQVIGMFQHGVNRFEGVPFPTGDVPYIGKLGFEYQRKKFTYSLAYIHRSNADLINQDEYNYNGVSVGIKYSHCIKSC